MHPARALASSCVLGRCGPKSSNDLDLRGDERFSAQEMLDIALMMRHNEYYEIGLLRGNHPGQREVAPPHARRARNDEGRRIMISTIVRLGSHAVVACASVAAVLATATAPSDGNESGGALRGYVLLAEGQATRYRGAQMPRDCSGTGIRPECSGSSSLCGDYDGGNCPSSVRSYSNQAIPYCLYSPPPEYPTACSSGGLAWCYTASQCSVVNGYCTHPWWGWTDTQERSRDTCISLWPPPPPPGGG